MTRTSPAALIETSTASGYAAAFVSLVGTAIVAFVARDDMVIVLMFAAALASAALVSAASERTVRSLAVGGGAALGGVFAFATWLATHLGGDQPAASLLIAWLAGTCAFVAVTSLSSTAVAWCVSQLRWSRS